MLRASAQGCGLIALKCGAVVASWPGYLSKALGLIPLRQPADAPHQLVHLQIELSQPQLLYNLAMATCNLCCT